MKTTIIVGSSADGKITYKRNQTSKDFSKLLNEESGKFLTNLREKSEAIVFTSRNIEIDNPNCRTQTQNYRIILDRSFSIDPDANILSNFKVIIFHSRNDQQKESLLKEKGEILSKGLFSNFVISDRSDNLISTLASDIKALGEKNKLNEDQILELVLCFVQNIPYDTTKAEDILSDKNVLEYDIPQYPYETLYKNSGICTDKAYLGSALLKELGYSTALLLFSEDQHMALGVKVDKRYGNFDSEYAMAEVTSPGFIPGDLPRTIDDNNGKPSLVLDTPSKISPNGKVNNQKVIKESDLSFPTVVIPLGEGKTYTRIAQVKELESRIYQKAAEIESIGDGIEFMEYDLIDANDNADYAYTDYLNQPAFNQRCGTRWDYLNGTQWWDCWEEENSTKNYFYNIYLDRLAYYNSLVDEYNSLIDDYNLKIDEIENLIDKRADYQFN